jgi:hypothetical protein
VEGFSPNRAETSPIAHDSPPASPDLTSTRLELTSLFYMKTVLKGKELS